MTDEYEDDDREPREERTVYWVGSQWCVTSFGLETVVDHDYDIEAGALGRLTDGSDEPMAETLRHVGSSHGWVDVDDLITAFGVALAIHEGKYRTLPQGAYLNAVAYLRRVRWMHQWSKAAGFREDDQSTFLAEMKASGAAADARELEMPFRQVPDPHPADAPI